MGKRYRNKLEDVAQSVLELKWKQMNSLATYLSNIEIDGTETPAFWAQVMIDWATDVDNTYEKENGE